MALLRVEESKIFPAALSSAYRLGGVNPMRGDRREGTFSDMYAIAGDGPPSAVASPQCMERLSTKRPPRTRRRRMGSDGSGSSRRCVARVEAEMNVSRSGSAGIPLDADRIASLYDEHLNR